MILRMPRRLLLILILLGALVPVARCGVTGVEVEPADPVQGDTVTLRIQASPGESVPITLSFTKALTVSGGEYDLPLNGVNIPQTPNNFVVRAEGVLNLNVAVKVFFWITKSADASGGVATVSQGGVPPGTYTARIYGQAAPGVISVSVTVMASTTVTMGPDGRYTFSYDTLVIPAGDFTAGIGGLTRSITLRPAGGQGAVNQKPLASASFKARVARGEDVLFDGSGSHDPDGVVVGWEWSFGDGVKGVGAQARHVYGEAGTYTVSLAVTDNLGAVSTSTWIIVVEELVNKPLSAAAGSGRTVFVGGRVDLSGEASSDPDGVIKAYRWDLGDGSTAEGVRVSHVYAKAGTYTVRLVVEDDGGATAGDEATIRVVDPPVEPSSRVVSELAAGEDEAVVESSLKGTRVRVVAGTKLPVSVTVLGYPGNPYAGKPFPVNIVPVFFDVSVSNPDAVEWPMLVEVGYDEGVLQGLDEASLGLFYWDGGAWRMCRETGVRVGEGVVWARVTRAEVAGSPFVAGERPGFADIQYSELLITPSRVRVGEGAQASVWVSNVGLEAGEAALTLRVDGVFVERRLVRLDARSSMRVSFELAAEELGVRVVELAGLTARFEAYRLKPADPRLEGLSVAPVEVKAGEEVEVSAEYRNWGEEAAEFRVEVRLDGLTMTSHLVALEGGGSTTIHMKIRPERAGDHTVTVWERSVSFRVLAEEAPPTPGEASLLPYAAGGVLILAAAALLLLRLRGRR